MYLITNVLDLVFTEWDLIIGPIYLLLFFILGLFVSNYKYKNKPTLRKHFMAGLSLKFIGCILFILVYTFYYGFGDTFSYFRNALAMNSLFQSNPHLYFDMMFKRNIPELFKEYPDFWTLIDDRHSYKMFSNPTTFIIVKLASLLGLISFNSFVAMSLGFAFFSYFGIWCLYRTFTKIFPSINITYLAIPILYIPSIIFWSSSILKDTVVMCFLGYLFYALYNVFIVRKNLLTYSIMLILSIIPLTLTKEYVLISFTPALLIWIPLEIIKKQGVYLQNILRPLMVIIAVFSIVAVLPTISKITERYALEAFIESAEKHGNYLADVSERQGGSVYSIGTIDYTPIGLVKAFPRAVNVTLFRPYLWEASNPVMLVSAIESLLTLLLTIFVFYKVGFIKYIRYLVKEPVLMASLIFALVFAFAVGLSTMNFGSLARYKLPCLPFYFYALLIPYFLDSHQKKLKVNG